MKYKEIVAEMVKLGVEEKEAKSIINWYQMAGFLIPSNIVSLIIGLLGIEISRNSIFLLIALVCMLLATKYVSKNVANLDKLKSQLKIIKPLVSIVLIIWLIVVSFNIFMLI